MPITTSRQATERRKAKISSEKMRIESRTDPQRSIGCVPRGVRNSQVKYRFVPPLTRWVSLAPGRRDRSSWYPNQHQTKTSQPRGTQQAEPPSPPHELLSFCLSPHDSYSMPSGSLSNLTQDFSRFSSITSAATANDASTRDSSRVEDHVLS